MKKEIITKHKNGVRVSDLAAEYGRAKSTKFIIIKNKEVIKGADVAKEVSVISKQRPPILEEVEKLLLVYINEVQLRGDNISESFICKKASEIYDDLVKKNLGTSDDTFEFKAIRGWFEKFKNRSKIHKVIRHGEASSSKKEATKKFVVQFNDMVKKEGLLSQQVFNAGETDLFWKKMPNRTYITEEEKNIAKAQTNESQTNSFTVLQRKWGFQGQTNVSVSF